TLEQGSQRGDGDAGLEAGDVLHGRADRAAGVLDVAERRVWVIVANEAIGSERHRAEALLIEPGSEQQRNVRSVQDPVEVAALLEVLQAEISEVAEARHATVRPLAAAVHRDNWDEERVF